MARYQKGSLLLIGNTYYGRFREDVELPDGRIKRPYRKVKLGTTEDFPTKRAARRELDKHLDKVNNLDYRPQSRLTFRQFVALYERDFMPTLKGDTSGTYRVNIHKHILPFFGEMALEDVTALEVQRFVNRCSPPSAKTLYGILRSIWRRAMLWGKVTHDPFPKKGIKLPETVPTDRQPFTDEEVTRIIATANEPRKTLYWILAETGIRISEALALTVEDIDWDKGRLLVRKSLNRRGKKIGTPKSRQSYRNPFISAALLAHLATRYEGQSGFLFPGEGSGPLVYNGALQSLHRLLDQLALPRRGFHCIRYRNATAMVELGADVKTVQTRLGHANPALSIGLYARAVPERERILAEQLGAKFAPKLHPLAESA